MEKIWRRYWPAGLDEAAIRLPTEPLSVFLKRHARRVPGKPALVFYGREFTFAELDEATDRFAGWLHARGLRPGDRLAIYLENCPQFAIAYFGGLKAGAVNVCLNPMHKATELLHELEDSAARVLVTSGQGYAVVEPIRAKTPLEAVAVTSYGDFLPDSPTLPVPPSFLEPARPASDTEDFLRVLASAVPLRTPEARAMSDTALLQYTSGTTGVPKGAELTHGNLVANCELQRLYIDLTEADVPLGVLPWFHITGMECQLNMMAYVGATLVALGRFELETVLRAIQRYRCTLTTLIATINVAIVNSPKTREYELSSLRACFSGGAPVPAETAASAESGSKRTPSSPSTARNDSSEGKCARTSAQTTSPATRAPALYAARRACRDFSPKRGSAPRTSRRIDESTAVLTAFWLAGDAGETPARLGASGRASRPGARPPARQA